MDLNIKDISTLLSMPEKELQKLIKKKEIPYQEIQDKLLFNKQQIIRFLFQINKATM